MRAPAVPLAAAFVAGCLLAPEFPSLDFALASSGSCLLAAGLFWSHGRERVATLATLAAFACLGWGMAAFETYERLGSPLSRYYRRTGDEAFETPRAVTARLRLPPLRGRDVTRLTLDVETVELARRVTSVPGGAVLSVHGDRQDRLSDLLPGDRVRLFARLRAPASFRNPGSRDASDYYRRERIDLAGSVKSALLVEVQSRAASASSIAAALRLRAKARLESVLAMRPTRPETSGILTALVTGDRDGLSPATARLFQRAGIFHIIAISGAHVAIWIFALHRLLRFLGLEARTCDWALMVLLPSYALFCGARPPVVRAVMMAMLVLAGRRIGVRSPGVNGAASAALVLLALDPARLDDPGFQLTFAAMGGIFAFREPISLGLRRLGVIAIPLGVSLAAQLAVAPIALSHFGRLTLAAPFASVLAVPTAGVLCWLGALMVLSGPLPLLGPLLSVSADVLVALLDALSDVTLALPGASLRLPKPTAWLSLAYVVGLALFFFPRRAGLRGLGVGVLALVVALAFPARPSRRALELSLVDVGHGDAMLLRLPDGQALLIDGGGLPRSRLDVGAAVVVPFLLERGVRRLSAVVLTHPDFDHIGGLTAVVDELPVGAVWEGASDDRPAYRRLRDAARRARVPFRRLAAGERIHIGGADIDVLSAGQRGSSASANDRSVVLRVSYAGRRLLLTGDAESGLERALLTSGVDLAADVLKVAHHGSRSSTGAEFLDAVRPKWALLSTRRQGSRPIPAEEVLERLRRRGVLSFRTDVSGAITLRIESSGKLLVTTHVN